MTQGETAAGVDGAASGLREQLRPSRLIPTVSAALVVGVLEVVIATSFAALIFSSGLRDHLAAGVGINLFAGAVILLVIALLSSQPGTIGSIQDTTAAIFALTAASIAARTPPGEGRFLTVVLALGLTSVVAGALFFVLGSFRLGDLVRFVPFPVVGGFLAGTGWLLVKGGTGVLTGRSLTLSNLSALAQSQSVAKWLPGLAFAVALMLLTRRYHHFLLIPGSILGAVAIFYLVVLVSRTPVGKVEAGGWLLGPFPRGGLWKPWAFTAVSRADWSAIFGQLGNVATILIVGLLALLLNASGIELDLDRDVDLNRELRAAGVANIAAGLGGGIIGYQALSLTSLAKKTEALSRLVGLLSAAICVAVLLLGASTLAKFPRPALGGMLVFLGLSFLVEWLYDGWFRLHRAEYFIVVLIVVVVAAFGFIQGVLAGIALVVVLFVVNYSRTDIVRHTLSGVTYHSTVDRTSSQRDLLRAKGEQVRVMELQGFIFFGTAKSLMDRVTQRVQDRALTPLRYLVLDFRRVTGLDSSAVLSFSKAQKLAQARGFTLVFTGLSELVRRRLERGGVIDAKGGAARAFSDIDHGVEWCEDQILRGSEAAADQPTEPILDRLRDSLLDGVGAGRLMSYLTRLEIPAGDHLIRQGEPAEELYFLESGRLTVQLETENESPLRLGTIGPGTVVGELPIYLGTPRAAAVISDTPSTLYRLSIQDFRRMEREDPEVAAALHQMFARLLARRLADSLQTMSALLD